MRTLSAAILTTTALMAGLAFLPAASAHTIDPIFPKCEGASFGSDFGERVCFDPTRQDDCPLWEERTTIFGEERNCLTPPPDGTGGSSTESASTLNCYQVYSRTDVGTYSIVRRNSCAVPEVYQCPYAHAPISQCQNVLTLTTSSQPMCMYYYWESSVGPVRIVQRDSCHQERYICDEDAVTYLTDKFNAQDFVMCAWDSLGIVGPVL